MDIEKKYRKKIIFFVFSSCIAILLIGMLREEPYSSEFNKNAYWTTKTFSDKKFNMVIYGDSRVYRGIDPGTMNKELPEFCGYNFGYSSAGINSKMLEFIGGRINSKAKNKMIIIGITPNSITSEASKNGHFNALKKMNWYDIFKRKYIKHLSFFEPINPRQFLNLIIGSGYKYYEKFHDNGWVESELVPHDLKRGLILYEKNFEDNKVDLNYVDTLVRYINTWNKKDIITAVINMPSSKEMVLIENQYSGYQENIVKNKIIKGGGIWIDFRRSDYVSYDGSHLTGESAKIFSNDLCLALRKELLKRKLIKV